MEKTMKRYGVNHRFSTSYHPQTSGQVENTNMALKRILEKTVKDNPAIWSRKLDDALWAFRTAYKTPTGTTPYKLIYGKNCHLPFEIEHRAYWALKNCNPDLIAAGEKRMFQLHELDELRHQAYENSRLYKERTKVWHDRKLRMRKEFKQGNKRRKLHDKTVQGLSSRVFTLELHDMPYQINQTVNEIVKEAIQTTLQSLLCEHFRDFSKAEMKEILHQRMFESGTYQSQPEHVALYEDLEASMDHDNRDELLEATAKSRKRGRDDQDLPPPPPDSDQGKKKRHDSDASGSKQPPAP
ncbi:reverse transcriptase domain-containing protein [Tanacetum coccineum]|uniref:Reverse transcriptase domain-containing protein n=1 Tax=Tanacetum coccineum TaxID=301880 RepID=A0ABQ4Z5X8_9ASTR